MSIIALIPITLIIAIIALAVFVIKQNGIQRSEKYWYGHRIKWMLGGYVAILLISVILFYLIPTENNTDRENVRIEDVEKEVQDFHNAVYEGRMDTVDSSYIAEQWVWDYHDNQLNIVVENNEDLGISIVAERKDRNDDKIEAAFYTTRSIIEEFDFTEKINPISMELSGNTLTIIKPEPVEIRFAKFNKEFALNQFSGEQRMNHHSSIIGSRLLYLRIPKDLELVGESHLSIQFLGE